MKSTLISYRGEIGTVSTFDELGTAIKTAEGSTEEFNSFQVMCDEWKNHHLIGNVIRPDHIDWVKVPE